MGSISQEGGGDFSAAAPARRSLPLPGFGWSSPGWPLNGLGLGGLVLGPSWGRSVCGSPTMATSKAFYDSSAAMCSVFKIILVIVLYFKFVHCPESLCDLGSPYKQNK